MNFWFNDVNLSRWMRANPTRRFAPTITAKTVEVPGADGGYFLSATMDPLTISVDVRLTGDNPDHRAVGLDRRMIAAALITDEPKKLILPDEQQLYYLAMLTNASELDTLWHTGGCTLEFTAYDPIAYGQEHTVELASGNNTVVIGGTHKTYPVFELKSTNGYVKVTKDNLDYVKLTATAAKDATVTIDTQNQVSRINTNNSAVDLESDYFSLEPGEHEITLENATGSLVYKERWV